VSHHSQYDTQFSNKPLNFFENECFYAGTQIDKVMQKLELVIDENENEKL
jgi:hypothetical protein